MKRSIKNEKEFCVRCQEKNSNRCQRLVYKIIEGNLVRNLSLCGEDLKAGHWTQWASLEDCRGLRTVESYSCAHGYQGQSRRCVRELGGRLCQDGEGRDVTENVEFRSVKCFKGPCPGIYTHEL